MVEHANQVAVRASRAPSPAAPEAELLEGARAGDRNAFEILATRAMPRLLGTATRLLGPGFAAEEAVADALFRAYRHIERFRGGSKFSTWAHRILCRVVADRYRELARDRRLHTRLSERLGSAGLGAAAERWGLDPADRLADREQVARVREVAITLPPTQRLVLLLFAWEDLSLQDIAALLSLKYATVKSHLHHARTTMRKRWESLGGPA